MGSLHLQNLCDTVYLYLYAKPRHKLILFERLNARCVCAKGPQVLAGACSRPWRGRSVHPTKTTPLTCHLARRHPTRNTATRGGIPARRRGGSSERRAGIPTKRNRIPAEYADQMSRAIRQPRTEYPQATSEYNQESFFLMMMTSNGSI